MAWHLFVQRVAHFIGETWPFWVLGGSAAVVIYFTHRISKAFVQGRARREALVAVRYETRARQMADRLRIAELEEARRSLLEEVTERRVAIKAAAHCLEPGRFAEERTK